MIGIFIFYNLQIGLQFFIYFKPLYFTVDSTYVRLHIFKLYVIIICEIRIITFQCLVYRIHWL